MKRKFVGFIFVLMFIFVICSCSKSDNNIESDMETTSDYLKDIEITKNEFASIVLVTTENIVYNKIDDYGNLEFMITEIDTGKTEICGLVENFVICNNSSVLMNNGCLYFFVTVSEDRTTMTNIFCKLDIEKHKLEQIYKEDNMQTFCYLSGVEDDIYITKGKLLDDDNGYTYIERYSINDGSKQEIVGYPISYSSGNGKVITNISIFDNLMYLTEELVEDGKSNSFISIYTLDGEIKESISMSKYDDNIFSVGIAQIYVNEEYIYITNMSNKSIIGTIENGIFSKIEEQSNLYMAQNSLCRYTNPVFYIRETNKLFVWDESSKRLSENDISEVGEEYYISYIAQDDEDGILIYFISEEDRSNDKISYMNISKLK